MKQKIFKDKYHIFEIEYKKSELNFKNIDEIISALKSKIDEHPVLAFIAIYKFIERFRNKSKNKSCQKYSFLFWKRVTNTRGFSSTP